MDLPYRFGRYVLTEKIAQGGMAEVFKATYLGESDFSKEVAIKRLLPIFSDNIHFVKMLIDEAKALVQLSHPNIVSVFELGRDGKILFLSMEWVDGIDLKKLSAKIPLKFILYIITEVLKALAFAHQKICIIHRDISPQNILLSYDGVVKLADFGIALGSHRRFETTHAQVKGKFAYMSPEQARGTTLTPPSDLYAVGIILYELLEGQRLFGGENDLAVLENVREAKLPLQPLQNHPSSLRDIVLRALQKNPGARYQTAKEFLSDLQKFILDGHYTTDAIDFSLFLKEIFPQGAVMEDPDSKMATRQAGRRPRRNIWLLSCAVAILFLTVGGGVAWNLSSGNTPKSLGSITIDTQPTSRPGILQFGGTRKNFVTPFYWGDLSLEKNEEGKAEIFLDKDKKMEETFVIGSEHPHWIKVFEIPKEKPGMIQISAKPWGEVTIPGVVVAQETPLKNLPLKKGSYEIRVYYPPNNQSIARTIEVASGGQVICQAEFAEEPSLSCR